jgi:3-methylcrotonyl-CoA carboxylase alpha subunit
MPRLLLSPAELDAGFLPPSAECKAVNKPISKLLIANRGEIALRIIRACRELGIRAVAVYSEADQNAPHVSHADEAYLLGPGPASESYLRSDKILEVAHLSGADAVHPGYGFLSENAEFAQACADAGLIFVGPPAPVIRLLGDKIRAKQLMATAGVPIVPGYNGDDQDNPRLLAEAQQIGAPLIIKAAAGGGGRGMRVVRSLDSFEGELEEARREAKAAFGDDRVLLERYVERSRHIEFQIFGDAHGNVIHLFERECSIQRRHQKIIEESPSPILTPALRARMAEAAVKAGSAAGYVNAGTVEFLFEERPDGDHRFYFLEVNTRLQVEHPVTELITGLDLVKLQLRVASGEPLGLTQEEVHSRGHAIEARIYAEDPATGFLPSIGRLEQWILPTAPWVRVDSGVERGGEVSPYYDPMLAKLIVYGATREDALARIAEALKQFHVLGVQTNIAYLLDIVRHRVFQSGALSTRFLAENFAAWKPEPGVPPEVLLALAAEALTRTEARASSIPSDGDGDPFNPWQKSGGWRNSLLTS